MGGYNICHESIPRAFQLLHIGMPAVADAESDAGEYGGGK